MRTIIILTDQADDNEVERPSGSQRCWMSRLALRLLPESNWINLSEHCLAILCFQSPVTIFSLVATPGCIGCCSSNSHRPNYMPLNTVSRSISEQCEGHVSSRDSAKTSYAKVCCQKLLMSKSAGKTICQSLLTKSLWQNHLSKSTDKKPLAKNSQSLLAKASVKVCWQKPLMSESFGGSLCQSL